MSAKPKQSSWRRDVADSSDADGVSVSVASSAERQLIKSQLDSLHASINQLESPSLQRQAAAAEPTGQTMESVLSEIASRLASIERLYSNMTNKLDKVDHRVEDSERHIRNLQHFSAGTINETARLVDFLGGRATPTSHVSASGAASRRLVPPASSVSPPPMASVPRAPLPTLDYVPGQLTATIQQHASHIHKLIAGLDFLEAHIIRQDQVIEGVRKQVDVSSMLPSDASDRLNEHMEQISKLQRHMMKAEKKAISHDQVTASLTDRVRSLSDRLRALEAVPKPGGAFFDDHDDAAAVRGPVVTPQQIAQLVSSQEDLRLLVRSLERDVHELRDQASAAAQPRSAAGPSDDDAGVRQQMSALMEQVATLAADNAELKKFATITAQRLSELQAADVPSPAAAPPGPTVDAATKQEVSALGSQLQELEAEVQGLSARVTKEVADVREVAVQPPALEELGQALLSQVVDQQAGIKETVVAMVASMEQEQAALKEQVAALADDASKQHAELQRTIKALQEELAQQRQQEDAAVATSRDLPAPAPAVDVDALKAELQERVAGVLEHIKQRVKESVDKVNEDVASLQEQLSVAVKPEQLSALEQQLQATIEELQDSLAQAQEGVQEQHAASAAALDALRSDLLVLGGQQGMLSSKVDALERTLADGVAKDEIAELRDQLDESVSTMTDALNQLRQDVSACATDADLRGIREAQEGMEEAAGRLVAELSDVQAQLRDLEVALANSATAAHVDEVMDALTEKVSEQAGVCGALAGQVEALRARLEEDMTLRMQQAADSVAAVNARLQREYINREQLGAIFAARADMKRAVDELASVFDTGGFAREREVADAGTGPSRASSARGLSDPDTYLPPTPSAADAAARLQSAYEELATKQTELTQQVQLLLYRSESAVRQEHLSGFHQAMVNLEMQVKRLAAGSGGSGNGAADGAPAAALTALQEQVDELQARLERIAPSEPATSEPAVHVHLTVDEPSSPNSPVHMRLAVEGSGGRASGIVHSAPATPLPAAPVPAELFATAAEYYELQTAVQSTADRCDDITSELARTAEDRERIMGFLRELQQQVEALQAAAPTAEVAAPHAGPSEAPAAAAAAVPEKPVVLQVHVADVDELLRRVEDLEAQAGRPALVESVSRELGIAAAQAAAPSAQQLEELLQRVEGLEAQVAVRPAPADLAGYAAATSAERATAVLEAQLQSLTRAVQEFEQHLSLVSGRVDAVAQQQATAVAPALPHDEVQELVFAAVSDQLAAVSAAQQQASDGAEAAAAAATAQLDSLQGDMHELSAAVQVLSADLARVGASVASLEDTTADVSALRAQVAELAGTARSLSAALPEPSLTAAWPQPGSSPRTSSGGVLPVATPRASLYASSPGKPSPGAAALAAAGQGQFLSRLVEVVKRQSSRLRSQYCEEAEAEEALAQVDSKLEEVEAHLSDARDPNSPDYAEAMVTVLEQVAALRFIGSQTHPAIHQMLLSHDSQLEQVTEQLKAFVSPTAGQSSLAALADAKDVHDRVTHLEAQLRSVAGQNAALETAIASIAATAERVQLQYGARNAGADSGVESAGAIDTAIELPIAALAAKLALLEDAMKSHAAEAQELRARSSTGGYSVEGGADSTVVMALEQKLQTLHTAAAAMRNRLVALQEYVDSTQGMIKDMHVALGSLHRRVDTLESKGEDPFTGSSSSVANGGADSAASAATFKRVQAELSQAEQRLLRLEASTTEMAHTLAGHKSLPTRLTEVEAKAAEVSSKVAAIGSTMPLLAGQIKSVERKLHSRLDTAYGAMDGLGLALASAARIQPESTANPFKAISAAVNNPVVAAMDKKLEAVRAAAATAVEQVLDDLKREQHERAAGPLYADISVRSGSFSMR